MTFDLKRFQSNKTKPRRKKDPDGTEYLYSPSAGRYIKCVSEPEVAARRKKKWLPKFVKVPWNWVEKLALSRSANTYRLALHLLNEHFKNGGGLIKVSNLAALEGAAIGRHAKRRALHELEALGLIQVEYHPRRSPLVTPIVEGPK